MKTKASHKLDSLPADLRREADKLITAKFDEPEIFEAMPKPSSPLRTNVEAQRPVSGRVQFPPSSWHNAASYWDIGNTFNPASTIEVHQPTTHTIDERTMEKVAYCCDLMKEAKDILCNMTFSFTPVGTFTHSWMNQNQIVECLRDIQQTLTITRGTDEITVRMRLNFFMENMAHGYGSAAFFECRFDNSSIIDGHYGMMSQNNGFTL